MKTSTNTSINQFKKFTVFIIAAALLLVLFSGLPAVTAKADEEGQTATLDVTVKLQLSEELEGKGYTYPIVVEALDGGPEVQTINFNKSGEQTVSIEFTEDYMDPSSDLMQTYTYKIYQMKPEGEDVISDDSVYTLKAYLYWDYETAEEGILTVKGVLAKSGSEEKPKEIVFQPSITVKPDEPPAKTGDTTNIYPFVIAMGAAAVIVVFLVLFLVVTKRKKDK